MKLFMRKVMIGSLRWHGREEITPGHRENGQWVAGTFTAPYSEWVDTGKRGILHGFFVEGSADGDTVVGLVELADGQFDTFSAACIKCETPYEDD